MEAEPDRAPPHSHSQIILWNSSIPAAWAFQLDSANGSQLGDLHAEILRPSFDIFPSESAWKFGLELVAQRHRVMVVERNKVISHREVEPALQDQPVLDRARDLTHVQGDDFIAHDGDKVARRCDASLDANQVLRKRKQRTMQPGRGRARPRWYLCVGCHVPTAAPDQRSTGTWPSPPHLSRPCLDLGQRKTLAVSRSWPGIWK
jgi:hypothetical protein